MPICNKQINELTALIHLHCLPQVGNKRVELLINHFGSATCAISESNNWHKLKIPPISIENINSYPVMIQVEQTINWLESDNHHLLTINCVDYPKRLLELNDQPYLLFVDGKPDILNNALQIAIVGGRNATVTGLDNAFNFAKRLAKTNFTITSGLAAGIDGSSHAGALSAQGTTIAVLGTGLPRIYPNCNVKLARDIVASGGALISEFAFNTPPNGKNFPKRNRIISALSLGTLVVEAGLNSGSLITARLAVEQGRNVWAIAGTLNNPLARGCHELIRKGMAILVENVEQIIET